MSVLSLNDDCLIQIFEMLSLLDLLSLHETCTRFRNIAARTFPSAHKEINLNALCPGADHYTIIIVDRLTRFLMAFGSSIAGLILKVGPGDDKIIRETVDVIIKYCSGTLKSFNFTYLRGNGKFSVNELRPLFASLEYLSFSGCVLEGDSLFADCHSLVDLKISDDYYGCDRYERYDNLFDSLHPQLESLHLDVGLPGVHLEKLIRNQSQLREVSLSYIPGINNILGVIADFGSKRLKSLKLIDFVIDRTMISQAQALFAQLESLSMKGCTLNIPAGDNLSSECIKLQSLTYYLNQSFTIISNEYFPQLRTFKLLNGPGGYGDDGDDDDTHLSEKLLFLRHHRHLLTKLTIWDNENGMISEFIAENMNNLEKIRIKSRQKCSKICISLSRMERIKKLTLDSSGDSWTEEIKDANYSLFLKGFVSLESIQYLDLTNVFVDNGVIEAIGGFKNLRELKLVFEKNNDYFRLLRLQPLESLSHLTLLKMEGPWQFYDSDLINLVTKLEKLKSLCFDLVNFVQLDKLYDKISEIVHNRRQSLVFCIKRDVKRAASFTDTSFVVIERDFGKVIGYMTDPLYAKAVNYK